MMNILTGTTLLIIADNSKTVFGITLVVYIMTVIIILHQQAAFSEPVITICHVSHVICLISRPHEANMFMGGA